MPAMEGPDAACVSPWMAVDEQRTRLFVHDVRHSFPYVRFVREETSYDGGDDQCQHQMEDEEQRPQSSHGHAGCISIDGAFGRWNSVPYHRLPEQQLRLTVVKLDGSSFDVQVMRSASVYELRLAVEEVFSRSSKDGGKISWSHVWGHFCLCYKGQKLIDDRSSLKALGIKDGDELNFIRHLSINYNPMRQCSGRNSDIHEEHEIDPTGPNVNRGSQRRRNKSDSAQYSSSLEGEDYEDDRYDDHMTRSESKLANIIRRCFSCAGHWCSGKRLRTSVRPSTPGYHYIEILKDEKKWVGVDI